MARQESSRGRRVAAVVALAFGLAGLVVSAAGLVTQFLPRHFSAAQRQAIMAWEVSGRWRSLSAGQIFPATAGYQLPATVVVPSPPLVLRAMRVAIAPQAACASGVTGQAAAVLRRQGCEAFLRATYVDETMSFVMTVGVAVLPTPAAAAAASAQLSQHSTGRNGLSFGDLGGDGMDPLGSGLRSMSFTGAAAVFYDYRRQFAASITAGPYLVLCAAGYADGRPRVPLAHDTYAQAEIASMAAGVAHTVGRALGSPPPLPHCPGAPGC